MGCSDSAGYPYRYSNIVEVDRDELEALRAGRPPEPPGQELTASRQLVSDLTRLLCTSCRAMEAAGVAIPDEVIAWWTDHQEWDSLRAERLRTSALEKLSPDEREALGIK